MTRTPRFALAAVLLGAAVSACGGHSSSTAAATSSVEPSYGTLPSFLPSDAVQADSEVTGSAASPAVTSQGDGVKVALTRGSVHVVVTGPEVPGEGFPDPPDHTTCTWTVTLSGSDVAVPLAAAEFTTTDHLGNVYRPSLVKGQPKPPALLQPGQKVSFELRTVMLVGEGLMRWAPDTRKVLASWDFTVEND